MKTSDKTFYQKVYEVVLRIPEGKVTSYGAIAEFLGMDQFVGSFSDFKCLYSFAYRSKIISISS